MNILITGGAGFIGSHLVDKLIDSNDVYVIDDFSTGNIENISNHLDNPKFHLVENSVLNEDIIRSIIEKCDVVFHMAAIVGVDLIMKDPVKTMITNISGTEIVLKHALKNRKRVILASTSEVYGKNDQIPFKEDANIVLGATNLIRWNYACSKAIDEFLSYAYYTQYNLPVTIVRLFNTVGPRQVGSYGMVVPRFVKSAINNNEITVYGDGEQSRCFGHVNDIVNGLVKTISEKKTYGEIINLGQPQPITINDLAKKVISLTSSQSKIVYKTGEEVYGSGFEDMKIRVPDITKAKKLINFNPILNIEDILLDCISYYKTKKL